jgi:hypothetical protein
MVECKHANHFVEPLNKVPLPRRDYPLLCSPGLRYPLAYAHVAELMRERGLAVDASFWLAMSSDL